MVSPRRLLNCLCFGVTVLVILSSPVPLPAAQNSTSSSDPEFLGLSEELTSGESLIVTFVEGMELEGTLMDLTPTSIEIRTDSSPRIIPQPDIARIRRRQNGVLLGLVIGLGAGAVLATQVGCDPGDECDINSTAVQALTVGMGAGAGLGIDAVIGSTRTLYERQAAPRVSFRPIYGPKRVGALLQIAFPR